MDNLLELLNEYQEQKGSEIRFKRIDDSDFFVCWDDVWLGYETILSKKFGFIKHLVENDKIEPLWKYIGWETDEDEPYIKFDLVDQYIAYLSIQDNPIEFLISILR